MGNNGMGYVNQNRKKVSAQVSEQYVKIILASQEEGTAFSEEHRELITTILRNTRVEGVCHIAEEMISKKVYWTIEPQIWEMIGNYLKSSRANKLGNDHYKNAVIALS